ncbi:unnamed protein product [Schistocephalus solidus]|uniref:Secreted protein n=1 Tax=Schistocephalus solidus TaxID=70667 RepID=A0A183T4V5_SCHSO|nr:unnamed protein product [Schistocephalus solidus]
MLRGVVCWVCMVSTASMKIACSSYEPTQSTVSSDQCILPPSDAREDDLDAPLVEALAPAELCPRAEERPAGRAGDKGDHGCQRADDHRLVISKMRFRLQPQRRPQGNRPPGKLNAVLLNVPAQHLYFRNELTWIPSATQTTLDYLPPATTSIPTTTAPLSAMETRCPPVLFDLQIHLTHQCGRSLANPTHRDGVNVKEEGHDVARADGFASPVSHCAHLRIRQPTGSEGGLILGVGKE